MIALPKSDARVEGVGYYALAGEHFFLPSQFNTIPLSTQEDTSLVDYILSGYKPLTELGGGYYESERVFDLTTAEPAKGKLNWVIRAPGLKEHGSEIIIKDIKVEYSKNGWFE
jgi:hypothetical protein